MAIGFPLSNVTIPSRLVFMIYRSFLRPILFRLSPETAHEFALTSLSFLLGAKPIRQIVASRNQINPLGTLKRFGLEFRNPIGLAAGFDKNGRYVRELAALGFGFIEVGSVTNEAQPGSPKPRVFRLPKDHALINRLGFNNVGAERVTENLRQHRPDCILGINIGKSRNVPIEEAIPDYLASFDAVFDVADYIAVNVSSPNTPNLRALQQHELLKDLLSSLQERNAELSRHGSRKQPKPLLLKIAPDLSEAEIESIVDVALRTNVSGIIATNTTIKRDGLRTSIDEVRACGQGGLSGAPLRDRSNQVISLIYRIAQGKLPIIGVGGVFAAEDAWEKICAGASLVQLYTGFIYEGPGVVKRISEGLAEIARREGFRAFDDAVGCSAE